MGVPRRSLNLGVSKQFSDHRQPFANEQPAGCECMAEIVNAYVISIPQLSECDARDVEDRSSALLLLSHDNVRIAGDARQRL